MASLNRNAASLNRNGFPELQWLPSNFEDGSCIVAIYHIWGTVPQMCLVRAFQRGLLASQIARNRPEPRIIVALVVRAFQLGLLAPVRGAESRMSSRSILILILGECWPFRARTAL